MKVYGIKTCDTVRKALKFLKEKGVEFDLSISKRSPSAARQSTAG